MRFVRWLIGLMVVSGLLLAAVVGLARQDRTPSALQRLGYDLCERQPCFRGVGIGMGWREARDALKGEGRLTSASQLTIEIGELNLARVELSTNEIGQVGMILSVHEATANGLDVMLGEVMVMYGAPCRIGRMSGGQVDRFVLVYPTMAVLVNSAIVQIQTPAPIVTIRPNSRVEDISIYANGFMGDCVSAPWGLWRGFASSETYLRAQQPRVP
ncbi:MAG: hypothetical protein KF716_09185 [Anaerolineae bacterium]|nr:hypothetical protein [Anaerolineae bacterium]